MIRLNNDWEYTDRWDPAFLAGKEADCTVRLPHTVAELPLHCIDPLAYQKHVGYRRTLYLPAEEAGRRQFLQFDGAAHIMTLYVNGTRIGTHRNGYTAYRAEITDAVKYGADNVIVVELDTTENPEVPPFGFAIDYLTYGGLYRDVWFDSRSTVYIEDVYAATPDLQTCIVEVRIDGDPEGYELKLTISDEDGFIIYETVTEPVDTISAQVDNAKPWDPDHPDLYQCTVDLRRDGEVIDSVMNTFGFRVIDWSEDACWLNGKEIFIRGLNRHQCWPYVGYAVPEELQREDARILKNELHVNAVRTSHYPQSHYFLDECDRIGLLVFTEIPGWQHIGDEEWKTQAVINTKEMVEQYRQHPSIFLWGVRINESQDDDPFYGRTNAMAHLVDPYRATSGVRYIEKSSLLEDVYSFNDFSHDGKTPPVKRKKDVTPDMDKPLIITEANGHMYPTKPFDDVLHREEHALRHARVLNGAMADGEHAGCFQWCMFDYPTHKDFGSGDRICYHGVMDSFRNPKLAAAVYASQQDEEPVLEISSTMDIGDYPGGTIKELYAFTNADSVNLYKNDEFVASFTSEGWDGLIHGPVVIDDLVGELPAKHENFTPEQAELIHDCLCAMGRYGLAALPLQYKAKLGYIIARYHMTFAEGAELYSKYVGNWGGEATRWRFEAIKNGKAVKTVTKAPDTYLHLDVRASHTELLDWECYDMAALRIRIVDRYNNQAVYAQLPVSFSCTGPIEIVGPAVAVLEGGSTGTYIRTTGQTGEASVQVSCEGLAPVTINFSIRGE